MCRHRGRASRPAPAVAPDRRRRSPPTGRWPAPARSLPSWSWVRALKWSSCSTPCPRRRRSPRAARRPPRPPCPVAAPRPTSLEDQILTRDIDGDLVALGIAALEQRQRQLVADLALDE